MERERERSWVCEERGFTVTTMILESLKGIKPAINFPSTFTTTTITTMAMSDKTLSISDYKSGLGFNVKIRFQVCFGLVLLCFVFMRSSRSQQI